MERFIVCKASAGSGKTYTLVRQFIETAISSPSNLQHRFEHILAITFTNKAANGMKERIMSQLYKVVCGEGSSLPLVKEMAGHLGITEAETVSRCRVLQESILHHYSYLSVCTIDSFVHRLVRTFAHDLRLPMNFNVQIEKQDIIQSAVDELMSLAGKEEESALTRVLCSFTESRMEEGASYNLERDIAELAKQIFEEETPQYLSQLEDIGLEEFVDIHKRLHDANRRFEPSPSLKPAGVTA